MLNIQVDLVPNGPNQSENWTGPDSPISSAWKEVMVQSKILTMLTSELVKWQINGDSSLRLPSHHDK